MPKDCTQCKLIIAAGGIIKTKKIQHGGLLGSIMAFVNLQEGSLLRSRNGVDGYKSVGGRFQAPLTQETVRAHLPHESIRVLSMTSVPDLLRHQRSYSKGTTLAPLKAQPSGCIRHRP